MIHEWSRIPNSDQWSISPTLEGVPRGDGRLNHDLLPGEKGPQDACGVFGVWAPGEEVAKLTYFGLYALQHRGQESAGIAVSNGSQILVFKDMGLVSQVFDETSLGSLQGHIAVGHARYSTTGASVWENAQPTFRATAQGSIALGHNGNLVNTAQLAGLVADLPKQDGRSTRVAATNDTDLITALLAGQVDDDGKPLTVEEAAGKVLPQVRGAFSLVFMDEHTLYAARDPQGIRPLVLGRLERGWVVASESAALDICGASYVREIEPGEFVAIDENGLRTSRFAEAKPKGCVFEYVYLARPDTDIAGRNVYLSRVEMGRKLAKEAPAEADLVIATPESGTPAAIGYAEASGIPFGNGLVKNAYVGRTFIQPSQTIRQLGIRLKLNPEGSHQGQAAGRRRRLHRPRQHPAGPGPHAPRGGRRRDPHPDLVPAREVALLLRHRLRHPRRADRQQHERRGDRHLDGRRLLAYISIDGMIEATTIAKPNLCRACFDGEYPMELPDPELLGKQLLETELAAGPAGTAAADAIRRP